MNERPIFTVGYHKSEMDFGVNCEIENLSYEQMRKFREILIVGIGVAEKMWQDSRQRLPENQAYQDK